MTNYYLRSILSNLKKSKKVNFFNILGLSVSIAACIMLWVYINSEYAYDTNNVNYKNIYQLSIQQKTSDDIDVTSTLPVPLANSIYELFPEIKTLCTTWWANDNYCLKDSPDKAFTISSQAVDSTFTDIFTLNFKYGTDHPLNGRDNMIISESTATKIFGNENPLGKVLLAGFEKPYTISGVFYDLPHNSSFNDVHAFTHFNKEPWTEEWSEWSFNHYYIMDAALAADSLDAKIKRIPAIADLYGEIMQERKMDFCLIPLAEKHFMPNTGNGNKSFVNTLIIISILLVVMAFANYMNFAFANIPNVIKTSAVKSVLGESKRAFFRLAFFEMLSIITLSFVIGVLLTQLIQFFFPDLLGFKLSLGQNALIVALAYTVFLLIGGLLSIFPAKIITANKVVMGVKGMLTTAHRKNRLGTGLSVIQFTFSIILIISILLIEKQIHFVKDYDLGFEKENIVVLNTSDNIQNQEDAFAQELMKNPAISDYSYSQFIPGGVGMGWGRNIDGKQVNFKCWPVDERYLNFMGIELKEGRNFSSHIDADEDNFIFNETAIKKFGWQENALGKTIPGFGFEGKLVGIVKDIKYASLYEEVAPLAFWLTSTRHNRISLKISGNEVSETMAYIKKVYGQFEKQQEFHYQFLDQALDEQYKSSEKQASLIFLFCFISLFISLIGILGMVMFMCQYKVKEIGIRKVNGAKTHEILQLLNKSFVLQVTLAFIIACPISWLVMNRWLQGFAYQTTLSWWIFALAGCMALGIALLTVSWQSWRAATRNPIESLRYE